MDGKKKKIYIIFIVLAVASAIIIVLIPTPKSKRSVAKNSAVSITAPAVLQNTEEEKTQEIIEEKKDISEEIAQSEENEYSGIIGRRVIKRDIFSNPFYKDPVNMQAPVNIQYQPVKRQYILRGILITDKIKSCTVDNGIILRENDEIDEYRVSSIKKGEVILTNKKDKTTQRLVLWEDKK